MSKKWEIRRELSNKNHEFSINKIHDVLLENRGIKTKKDKEAFLYPNLSSITVDSVGIDNKHLLKALKRIKLAIDKKEQIIVFGDYDVDGITGSAILWETLFALHANVMPYIPHRIDEGYGLTKIGIDNIEKKFEKIGLIITVDNGIVANEAVDFANSKGIDVIITDHHLPHDDTFHTLPNAYAIVHTTRLCGAGVAFLLAQEILNFKFPIPDKINENLNAIKDEHLALAALGTIADMVPLIGANRVIVSHGLKNICETKREGLLALFNEAGIDHTLGITPYHVGFMIAPRLNASGRLESAMDSLRLLCTKDKKRAQELAYSLGQVNRERQLLMKTSTLQAIETIKNQELGGKNILISVSEQYKEGIIGLVAGKLVEEYYRPSIVIAKREKHSKASVRSIKGFNIIEFLRSHSEFFVNVGGHPMAAGFTIETEKIELLIETLESSAEKSLEQKLLERVISIDIEIDFQHLSDEIYTAIQQLAPFGIGNPEPVFLTRGVNVKDIRVIGKEGKHLKLKLSAEGGERRENVFDAIAFGMGDMAEDVKIGDTIDIVYCLDENVWNGKKSLQLKIKDFRKN